jgi:hypothetical protein
MLRVMNFRFEMHLGLSSLHNGGGFGSDSYSGGGNSRNRRGYNVCGGIPVAEGFGNEVTVDVGLVVFGMERNVEDDDEGGL